jgi:glycosyltransferase involved in cell wall biosynthesis
MNPPVPDPVASVIVCTRDRAALLRDCLDSLLADTSAVPRELIIVDNASTDGTRDVVRAFEATPRDLHVRYVLEHGIGKSHALNRALAEARGRFFLFTDDDVTVEDGWADALVTALEMAGAGAAGGRILPRWELPPPDWMSGPHAVLLTLPDFGEEARELRDDETPIGANMAIRADVVRPFRPVFETTLGHRPGMYLGAEEWHLAKRIARTHRLVYTPAARAHHRIPPERVRWAYLRRAWFQGGFAIARLERLAGDPQPGLPRRLVRAIRTLRGAARIRSRNERRPSPRAAEAWEEFSAYMWAGKHVDMVFARFPAVANWFAKTLVRGAGS